MTVAASIPQKPTSRNVELLTSADCPDELWVLPTPEVGLIDLPRLRHLLPAEYRDAPCVGFIPVEDTHGGWILRRAA